MSLGPQDLEATTQALRVTYSDKELMMKLQRRRPLMAAMKKNDAFVGESFVHVIQHGYNQGIGATMDVAEATMSTDLDAKFTVLRRTYLGAGRISRPTILATRDNKGAAAKQLKRSYDGLLLNLGRYLDAGIWGDGGGAYAILAKVGTGDGLATAKLVQIANKRAMHWIEKDQIHNFSATSGADGLTTVLQPGGGEGSASTGIALRVAKVNRRDGIIEYADNVPAAVVAGQYLFRRQMKGQGIQGVRAWCPQDDATAASTFLGQDRSLDLERLAGLRWLTPNGTYAQTIRDAVSFADVEGGDFSNIYMNSVNIGELENSERGLVKTDEKVGDLKIGFNTIKFRTPIGDLDLQADAGCPEGWAMITNPNVWEFRHLGKFFGFFEEDGLLHRIPGYDGYGFRGGGYGNVVCDDPKSVLWVKLKANASAI